MINIGISGDEGSFSEAAGRLYINKHQLNAKLTYLTDMERVLAALTARTIDIGIFPVVNFRGGLVKMAFDAMGKYPFTVIDEIWLDIQQCLLTNTPIDYTNIQYIVSHPQGLAQCKNFIATHCPQAELIEWEDTAKAAHDLAAGRLKKHSVVIAPAHAAEVYQLTILAHNIQDIQPNYTVFIVTQTR